MVMSIKTTVKEGRICFLTNHCYAILCLLGDWRVSVFEQKIRKKTCGRRLDTTT